jgi:hypothetical protein
VPPDDLVLVGILGLLIQFVGQLVDSRDLIRDGYLISDGEKSSEEGV